MNRKIERDVSLDIIRSAALFFILCVHSIINCGFSSRPMVGINSFAMVAMYLISYCCVPLFLMLTGSLMNKRQLNAAYYIRYLSILVPYLFLSCICQAFNVFYCHQELSLRDFLSNLLSFYGCEYTWYLMLYTGLYLIIPFLNVMYHGLDSRRKKLLLVFSFFALSHLASLLNSYFTVYHVWWRRTYPISFYFLGAYLNEYRSEKKASHNFVWLLGTLIFFSVYDVFYMDRNPEMLYIINYEFYQIFFISALIFIWLRSLDTKKLPNIVLWPCSHLSRMSFYIFLLSSITDKILYPIVTQRISDYYSRDIYVPFTAIISLLMAVLLAVPLYPIGEYLAKISVKFTEKVCKRIEKYIPV